ncbi:hypothetical protein SAMN05519103_09403 [Rhizobiales bacterium GAS113]|nr:hypothetical protein SAMN05519103_09403 [Rhizobiales bacterium GAS113]SEF06403.1 hypothetical protein SAMN05519104_8201 [Rhizobiales bacterium GAS188]
MTEGTAEAEYEIKQIAGGRFRATLHSYQPHRRWLAPQVRECSSEKEAMIWINSLLTLRGFEPAYDLETSASETG